MIYKTTAMYDTETSAQIVDQKASKKNIILLRVKLS